MDRSTDLPRESRIEAERKLLAALCQGALDARTRGTILQRLKHYVFAEPDHEVLYRALATMPAVDPADARQALTQAVTRLGFPDVDLDSLFTLSPPKPAEVAALLELL